MSAAMVFFVRDQECVRNSRGKRAIDVRAIEVLLYYRFHFFMLFNIFITNCYYYYYCCYYYYAYNYNFNVKF